MNSSPKIFSNDGVPVERLIQCAACQGRDFEGLHDDVRDFLFGSPGTWSYRRCRACGTIALDPRPVDNGFGLVYTPAYSARKGSATPRRTPRGDRLHLLRKALQRGVLASSFGYAHVADTRDRILALLLGWLPGIRERAADSIMDLHYLSPEATLLDVGCGVGQFMSTMKSLGWKVIGVDTDERVVETAQAAGLDARCGLLEKLELPGASFDVITLRHVIEHVSDPAALLSEIRRILKPGGFLCIATPNADSTGQAEFGAHWLGLDVSRHMQIFTKQSLVDLSQKVGFKRIEVRSSWRITRFVATVSHAHRKHQINAYLQRVPFSSRLYWMAMLLRSKLPGGMGRYSGDELVLRAYR